MTDTPQFKEFDSAAQDLIRFGTTWISNLDEGSISRLRNELSHIATKTEASVKTQVTANGESAPAGAGLRATSDTTNDTERVQAEAERAIFTSIEGLRATQAEEFGRLFARAQTAFRALRLVLQTKSNSPSRAP